MAFKKGSPSFQVSFFLEWDARYVNKNNLVNIVVLGLQADFGNVPHQSLLRRQPRHKNDANWLLKWFVKTRRISVNDQVLQWKDVTSQVLQQSGLQYVSFNM